MAYNPSEFAALPGYPVLGWWPTGTVDEETVLEYYGTLASYPAGTHRYCDFSAVREFSFGYRGLEKLVRVRKNKLPDHIEIKLVMMSTTVLGYGMSRMYEGLMNGFDLSIHVVRSVEEAAELLELSVADLSRPGG